MHPLWKDLRFALRGLRRRPLLTFVAILSLALGIGANGTVFSLVHGMLFRPLDGVVDEHRLARIYTQSKSFDFPLGVSVPNFHDLEDATGELVGGLAAQMPALIGVAVGGEPARVALAAAVYGDYFGVLGTTPAHGRLFTGDDVDEHARVVVVSHSFWRQRMAANPNVVGESVELNGESFVVAGVAPPGFSGTEVLLTPDVWVPLPAVAPLVAPGLMESRDSAALRVTGRLRDGVELTRLESALAPVSAHLAEEYPEANRSHEHRVMAESDARLEAGLGEASRRMGFLLLALCGGVLLIACANIANLLLSRAAGQRKDLAVQVALGAGRWQMVRRQLCESLLLAAAGGVAGVAIAFPAAHLVSQYRPPVNLPVNLAAEPDLTVLLFMIAISLVAGVAFGLAPALRSARTDPARALRGERSGGKRPGRPSFGSLLVVGQVGLSLVLLVAAGLFVRSLQAASHLDLGFDAEGIGVVTFDLSTAGYDEAEGRTVIERMERRLRSLPGVDTVVATSALPMDWYANGVKIGVGRDLGDDVGDELVVLSTWAGPGYFAAVDTPILAGRGFRDTDDAEHPKVMLVNQELAQTVWPGEDAVGRILRLGGRDGEPAEVIGVVPTGKYRLPGEAPRPFAFLPLAQDHQSFVSMMIETRRPLAPILRRARSEIEALAPHLAIQDAQPLGVSVQSRIQGPMALVASLAGAFGLLGLVLAAVGLYGVISLQVVHRRREIGIRMAIGARSRQVLASVVRRGLGLAVVGLLIGGLLSLAAGRLLGNFLVGISPYDPVTFVGVVVVLMLVAALASLVPAFRATRIDPVRTLKES